MSREVLNTIIRNNVGLSTFLSGRVRQDYLRYDSVKLNTQQNLRFRRDVFPYKIDFEKLINIVKPQKLKESLNDFMKNGITELNLISFYKDIISNPRKKGPSHVGASSIVFSIPSSDYYIREVTYVDLEHFNLFSHDPVPFNGKFLFRDIGLVEKIGSVELLKESSDSIFCLQREGKFDERGKRYNHQLLELFGYYNYHFEYFLPFVWSGKKIPTIEDSELLDSSGRFKALRKSFGSEENKISPELLFKMCESEESEYLFHLRPSVYKDFYFKLMNFGDIEIYSVNKQITYDSHYLNHPDGERYEPINQLSIILYFSKIDMYLVEKSYTHYDLFEEIGSINFDTSNYYYLEHFSSRDIATMESVGLRPVFGKPAGTMTIDYEVSTNTEKIHLIDIIPSSKKIKGPLELSLDSFDTVNFDNNQVRDYMNSSLFILNQKFFFKSDSETSLLHDWLMNNYKRLELFREWLFVRKDEGFVVTIILRSYNRRESVKIIFSYLNHDLSVSEEKMNTYYSLCGYEFRNDGSLKSNDFNILNSYISDEYNVRGEDYHYFNLQGVFLKYFTNY